MEHFYKDHTLPSGEVIWMTTALSHPNPTKPWEVGCANGDEVRWTVYFATKEEAEKEYIRFD